MPRKKKIPFSRPYDQRNFNPPAPVMEVSLSVPSIQSAVLKSPALLDSGADITVIPEQIIQQLQLRYVDEVTASGYDGIPRQTFIYSVKFGLVLEIIIASSIFLLAPYITFIFTTGQGSEAIASDLERFIKISCFFYPGAAFGISSSATFQGIGKGVNSLIATSLRTIILTPILASVFCCIFFTNLEGIWWGIVIANLLGSAISFVWVRLNISKIQKAA